MQIHEERGKYIMLLKRLCKNKTKIEIEETFFLSIEETIYYRVNQWTSKRSEGHCKSIFVSLVKAYLFLFYLRKRKQNMNMYNRAANIRMLMVMRFTTFAKVTL